MNIDDISVLDFKNQFFRDFPYLPIWDNTKTYKLDDVVYYSITDLFYKSKKNVNSSIPTNSTDWEIYSDDVNNYILDADIEKSQLESRMLFNGAMFGTDEQFKMGFNYLTAHFLVLDIRRAGVGINSKGDYLKASKSVGSVSESNAIPQTILNNPLLNGFATTGYGQKYLMLIYAKSIGRVNIVNGGSRA